MVKARFDWAQSRHSREEGRFTAFRVAQQKDGDCRWLVHEFMSLPPYRTILERNRYTLRSARMSLKDSVSEMFEVLAFSEGGNLKVVKCQS